MRDFISKAFTSVASIDMNSAVNAISDLDAKIINSVVAAVAELDSTFFTAARATSGFHFELLTLIALCVLWACLYIANRWVRRGNAKTASYQLPPLRTQLLGLSPWSAKRQQQPQQPVHTRGKDHARDTNSVTEQILYNCAADFPKALELYRGFRAGKPDLAGISTHARGRMFTGLVMAALRVGLLDTMLQLLHDARAIMGAESAHLFAYCIKLSASKRLCEHGLAIYKLYKWDQGSAMDEKTVWSSLIFCAVETKTYDLCQFFFSRVQGLSTPSAKDYGHMIRCKCSTDGWRPALKLLDHMCELGLQGDTMIYNMVLASCVAGGEMEVASTILKKMERQDGIADVITYNTLAKGYSRAGRMDKCLQVYEGMRAKGFVPTQVTYGILLDGYINDGQVEQAAWVFENMVQEGCPMNTVLLTTLMKGLAQAGRIDQAMEIYKRMLADGESMPDLVTFSVLIKANCKADRQDVAMGLFNAMKKAGVQPDAYIYNHLIAGCADLAKAQQARQLYQEMISSGVKPTNITLSVLIRVLERCRLLKEASALLETEPVTHGIAVEARVYLQLLRAHLRERQGRHAARLYKMMLMRSSPTDDMTADILDCCAKMHLPETLTDIVDIAREAGLRFNPRAAEAISRANTRKTKLPQPMHPGRP